MKIESHIFSPKYERKRTDFGTYFIQKSIGCYYAGAETSSRETFVNFIVEFLPQYAPHAGNIFACIRNGLAHDYIIKEVQGKSFRFTRNIGEAHRIAVEGKPEWFYINREIFAKDFTLAQSKYFKKLHTDTDMQEKAIRRLKKRSFLSVFPKNTNNNIFTESTDIDYPMVTGTYPPDNLKF